MSQSQNTAAAAAALSQVLQAVSAAQAGQPITSSTVVDIAKAALPALNAVVAAQNPGAAALLTLGESLLTTLTTPDPAAAGAAALTGLQSLADALDKALAAESTHPTA
jgi:hypothetical protein